jgi:hypothetical protein
LDCVIIDHALLPDDVDAFCNGLKEATKNAGLQCPADGPHAIVIADDNDRVRFDKLLKSKIYGLVYKPIEIRRLLYLVANSLDTPYSVYTFENIGWKHDKIGAKIARKSQLAEMSEFGATIRTEQPLKPGTMLYLFKSIFQNAPDQNLCVRVYASEEDPKNDGQYLNWVVYFGITDAFLKFTRAYIRETYAVLKAQGEKGGAE